MTMLFNPYDVDLDLTEKYDQKLFTNAYNGLQEKEDLFDGKKGNYDDSVKLMETHFEECMLMEALVVPTK